MLICEWVTYICQVQNVLHLCQNIVWKRLNWTQHFQTLAVFITGTPPVLTVKYNVFVTLWTSWRFPNEVWQEHDNTMIWNYDQSSRVSYFVFCFSQSSITPRKWKSAFLWSIPTIKANKMKWGKNIHQYLILSINATLCLSPSPGLSAYLFGLYISPT